MYKLYKHSKILKILSNDNYKLLKVDENINNKFYFYLIYSLIPNDLNKLNNVKLNNVVKLFKKNINKYVVY